jgi:crossover junction endodeoxyribonuclease RuvC
MMREQMFDSCVMGVDPGVAKLGLAVVARDERRPTLVWADAFTTDARTPEADRLKRLADAVREAIATYRPMSVAVERVAFNRNQVSALTVARATGALMVAAAEAGLAVEEYSPTEVKSAVTGAGDADKRQVRDALERVHGFRDLPSSPDAADAAAVALTHLGSAPLRAAARAGAAR